MNSNWNKKSSESYEMNLANVLILRVTYYENYGWRGSIEGAFNFPSHTNFYEMRDAMLSTEETAKHMLSVATNKLAE